MRRAALAVVGSALALACSGGTGGDDVGLDAGDDAGDDTGTDAGRDAAHDVGNDSGDAFAIDAAAPDALRVQALGVQGFVLTFRGESVMSAPLFTRQNGVDVALNAPITIDVPGIEDGLADVDLGSLRAIVSGHAHYDHLMDLVHVMGTMTPTVPLYANRTARHVLAAVAPDRDPSCTSPAPTETIDRARIVALDDPLASHVDYTNCPDQQPAGAPLAGSWVSVPGSHVRLMPICTTHPAQIGTMHFAPGSIDTDQCDLPAPASGWLEGQTLGFVIDFLDDTDTAPLFRIYYQDAPATRPVGEVPAAILAERRVDLAVLCAGSNDAVENQPTDILANVDPRFAIAGHWESFFVPRTDPVQPIPFLHVDLFVERAEAALAAPPDAPLYVDGAPIPGRHVLIYPGMELYVPSPP